MARQRKPTGIQSQSQMTRTRSKSTEFVWMNTYRDPEADYEEFMVRRNAPRWIACFITMACSSAPPPRAWAPDTRRLGAPSTPGHRPGPPEARLRLQPPRARDRTDATSRRHGYARLNPRTLSRQNIDAARKTPLRGSERQQKSRDETEEHEWIAGSSARRSRGPTREPNTLICGSLGHGEAPRHSTNRTG